MTPAERISYLIYELEGGNAKNFADKCNIPEASLSRVRNGKAEPLAYYPRIIKSYPQIRRKWLLDGEGEPTKEKAMQSILGKKIDALTNEVKRLTEMVELLSDSSKNSSKAK